MGKRTIGEVESRPDFATVRLLVGTSKALRYLGVFRPT